MPKPACNSPPRARRSSRSTDRGVWSRCQASSARCLRAAWCRPLPLAALAIVAACAPRSASPGPVGVSGVAPLGAADVETYARLLQMADERRLDTGLVREALHAR